MRYDKTVPFHGDAAQALEAGVSQLTSVGFRVAAWSEACIDLQGPRWVSHGGNLNGASRIRLMARSDALAMEAEIRGARPWVGWLLLGCWVVFFGLQVWLASLNPIHGRALLILQGFIGASLIAFLLLMPMLYRQARNSIWTALDGVLHHMATAGGQAFAPPAGEK